MNAGQLQATLSANRVPLMGAAAVGVAGFAYYKKKHPTAGVNADSAATAAGDVPLSAGGQVANATGGAYDSTSADLAGFLGPQLDAIGQQQAQLQELIKQQHSPTPVPVNPVPKPTPPHGTGLIPTPAPKPAPHPTPHPVAHPPTPVHTGPKYAVDTYYTVKPGDSLSKIAARYTQQDITSGSIYTANRSLIGSNQNLIHPGTKLHIRG